MCETSVSRKNTNRPDSRRAAAGEYVCRLPALRALRVTWHGGYGELQRVYETIRDWAEQARIPLTGLCRNTYLEGPPQHREESKFITQEAMIIRDE